MSEAPRTPDEETRALRVALAESERARVAAETTRAAHGGLAQLAHHGAAAHGGRAGAARTRTARRS